MGHNNGISGIIMGHHDGDPITLGISGINHGIQ